MRIQAAKKGTSKTLSNLKKLLQTYAFARPSVRFALKVLKSKHDKGNWSYAPKLGLPSMQEAVSKIFGPALSGQCELRSNAIEQRMAEQHGQLVTAHAFLVKSDAGEWFCFSDTSDLTKLRSLKIA